MTLTEFETTVREQLPTDGRRLAVPGAAQRERQAARDEIAAAKELKVRVAWLTSLAALTA